MVRLYSRPAWRSASRSASWFGPSLRAAPRQAQRRRQALGRLVEKRGCVADRISWQLLLQHYLGRLDHGGDRVADLELHLFGAALGDEAFDHVLAGANDHVRHHAAEFDLHYFSGDAVARGERHGRDRSE